MRVEGKSNYSACMLGCRDVMDGVVTIIGSVFLNVYNSQLYTLIKTDSILLGGGRGLQNGRGGGASEVKPYKKTKRGGAEKSHRKSQFRIIMNHFSLNYLEEGTSSI